MCGVESVRRAKQDVERGVRATPAAGFGAEGLLQHRTAPTLPARLFGQGAVSAVQTYRWVNCSTLDVHAR